MPRHNEWYATGTQESAGRQLDERKEIPGEEGGIRTNVGARFRSQASAGDSFGRFAVLLALLPSSRLCLRLTRLYSRFRARLMVSARSTGPPSRPPSRPETSTGWRALPSSLSFALPGGVAIAHALQFARKKTEVTGNVLFVCKGARSASGKHSAEAPFRDPAPVSNKTQVKFRCPQL